MNKLLLLLGGGVALYYFAPEIEAALGITTAPAPANTAAANAALNAVASGASPSAAATAAANAAITSPPASIVSGSTGATGALATKIYQAALSGQGGNIPLPASGLFDVYQWNFYYSLVTGLPAPDMSALGPGTSEVNAPTYLNQLAAQGLV